MRRWAIVTLPLSELRWAVPGKRLTYPSMRMLVMMRRKSKVARVAKMTLVEFRRIFGRRRMMMQTRLPKRPIWKESRFPGFAFDSFQKLFRENYSRSFNRIDVIKILPDTISVINLMWGLFLSKLCNVCKVTLNGFLGLIWSTSTFTAHPSKNVPRPSRSLLVCNPKLTRSLEN